MATFKRLKRGDDNELEGFLRLEKVFTSKQLRLVVETEEELKTRQEDMVASAQFMLALMNVLSMWVQFDPQTHSEKLVTMLNIQS